MFSENETSLPRACPLGELARQRLRGQARQNKTRKRSDTMSLTNRACIAVFFVFCQHPCPLRLLRRHLSQSERLWHSVTFFSKRKSVSSKTKPLCQGLSCQESCRADARLRGWTKDAFRLSEDDGEVSHHFREIPETDKIPETPANSTGTVILIYPTRVCFARVSRHKFVTFCWRSAQTFGGINWAISTRNG